ncbi:Conserved protein of uncharacterised function with PIN domain [Mycobacterium tuberculosis]|nr:Conserved protein of uncharacterised function with PIN domain [Mycobacterium tuberculosis]
MALKYLLDTSVIKRLSRPAVRRAVEPLAEAGAVARTQITDLKSGTPHAMRPSGSGSWWH